MAIPQHRNIAHGNKLEEDWLDALEKLLAAGGSSWGIVLSSSTTVALVGNVPLSGANSRLAALPINGKWRFLELDVVDNWQITRAHPGGAAGTYFLFAVASDNEFVAGTPEVDNTYYGFELRITSGAAPTGNLANGKPIAHYQVIRSLEWDGAAITAVKPLVNELGVYRSGLTSIKTDGSFEVAGALTKGGIAVALTNDARILASEAHLSAWKDVASSVRIGIPGPSTDATTRVVSVDGISPEVATNAAVSAAFPFDPADYAVAGKTLKIRIRAALINGSVQPGINWTLGLARVTTTNQPGGAGFPLRISAIAAIAGAQTVVFNNPAANTLFSPVASAEFDAPAAGWLVLTIVGSGVPVANTSAHLRALLQMRTI